LYSNSRTVTLTAATRAQEPVIQNLMQLYTHDFSEYWTGTAKGDLLPDGRFPAYPMAEYWSRTNWSASLICLDDVLAGFALINDRTHSGEPANRNVGEFFVLRKHRAMGVGRRAAAILFDQYPGSWEVAVARSNLRAYDFWKKAIGGAAQASSVREFDLANADWNGPVFRFEWRR
jgi:predicted acetyltransferase